MRIGIVGASASGLYTAVLLAQKHPDWRIEVFDRMEKAGKKLLATGNGHCNLLHNPIHPPLFHNSQFVSSLLRRHPMASLFSALESMGVATMSKDELVYPLSYSAAAYVRQLVTRAEKLGIVFRLGMTVMDMDDATIIAGKQRYPFDKVVFAFGGKSQENLGSDGSMFRVLAKQGYRVTKLVPSLCPLRCLEVGNSLFGVRHHAVLELWRKDGIVYQEDGEIQFKKGGVSGIAVMNASSEYEKGDWLRLDFFPNIAEGTLVEWLLKDEGYTYEQRLIRLVETPFARFLLKRCNIEENAQITRENCVKIAKTLKKMELSIEGLYGFDASQVTRGGIALEEVDEHLRSKTNPNHYFVGECLDVDGLCGGYNLGFALLSAMEVVDSL
ncbi:MAG: aminoacetone oxidase family FAD-binding enzyme [Bacilli bacterium]|nr:aminoacetone oxidase family FAD-binding enzyme [Bacilli bacterium]